ncbi:MAG TPA: UbiA family prenyltransferase, partial [Geobacteraceae bacterium]
ASSLLAIRYLNSLTLTLVLAAVLSYGLLYTLCLKRRSPWGAVMGGIPGALPVLVGYAAVANCVRIDGIILFAVMLLWQPPHFWALALEYSDDYRAASIPVLPVTHGKRFTAIFTLIFAASLVPASLLLWFSGFCSARYACAALIAGVAFLASCYLFIVRKERYALAFNASIIYLTLLFAAIIGDICFFGVAP